MQNCGIKVEYRRIIKQIKKELIPASYAECGKCGAINVNAKELARAIESIAKDDDEGDCEEIYTILYSIIEVDPESELSFTDIREWDKWESENAHRLCPFVEGYEGNVYIAYANVILYTDENCECFNDKFE